MKRTVEQWRVWLTENEVTDGILKELLADQRRGVQQLAVRIQKQQAKAAQELARLANMWNYERELWSRGYSFIAGVDEAGRGPLAGPVVAAAVVLPENFDVTNLNDSKQVTAAEREKLRERIEHNALAIGVGIVDAAEIDRINILQATYKAMQLAIAQLGNVDYLLLDAIKLPGVHVPQQSLIKGDSLSHSIAAASIMAKTTRDRLMKQLHKQYPQYGFDQHMGYGVPAHLQMLHKYGPCAIHRRSFAPVKAVSK
jgi:ribonuclease HII